MKNFCSTLYLNFEHLFFFLTILRTLFVHISRKLTMLNMQLYQNMLASTVQLSEGLAASSGLAWANKFLTGRSKDKSDSLYLMTSTQASSATW
jgi:hypothetical protein